MRPFAIKPASGLRGEVFLPGDKSIAHRAVMCGALSFGRTRIENFPANKDCLVTLSVFKKLGIKIIRRGGNVVVFGQGLHGLKGAKSPIFLGESGTTCRLALGVLAGQDFQTVLAAGRSLNQRPMLRVTNPLRMMGANIKARRKGGEEFPPIIIRGGNLRGISYKIPVASAQVKSAILLAGLYSFGTTCVIEILKTRDHTERMMRLFKAGIRVKQNKIFVKGGRPLASPGTITVPGDISSAAFFLVAGAVVPNSRILIKNVSLNPTRIGVISVLKRMGAKIELRKRKLRLPAFEPAGDILIKSSKLAATTIRRKEVPALIDELPVLMVAASLAKGRSVFEGVGELRVKETDRIRSMIANLKNMGADIRVAGKKGSERIIISSGALLQGGKVRSFGDHRTAMSMIIAGLAARNNTFIDDISCISKSFPGFVNILAALKI